MRPENIADQLTVAKRLIADAIEVVSAFSQTGTFHNLFSSQLTTSVQNFKGAEADLHFLIDSMPPEFLKLAVKVAANGPYAIGFAGGVLTWELLKLAVATAATAGAGAVLVAPQTELMLIRAVNTLEKIGVTQDVRYLVRLAETVAPDGWISKLRFGEYLDEVQRIASNRKMLPEQRRLLLEAIETRTFRSLGDDATAHRALFNSKKAELIKEWERQTKRS